MTMMGMKKGGRIPAALQAIFLASNAGNEVYDAPKEAEQVYAGGDRQKTTDGKPIINLGHSQMHTPLGLKNKKLKDKSSKKKKSRGKKVKDEQKEKQSPKDFLKVVLKPRGYSTKTYDTLTTGYSNKPSFMQMASYDAHLVELVESDDIESLRDMFSVGISPNPCNEHGESLMHAVCRLGKADILKLQLEYGATVQCSDDMGRNPLHSVCRVADPCMEVVDVLLQQDVALLHLEDKLGASPLTGVAEDHWPLWIDYLYSHRDVFWPRRNKDQEGSEPPPPLTQISANTRKLADPSIVGQRPLMPRMATMVARGVITPEEVRVLQGESDTLTVTSSIYSEDDFSDTDSEDDFDDDDSIFNIVDLGGIPEHPEEDYSDHPEEDYSASNLHYMPEQLVV